MARYYICKNGMRAGFSLLEMSIVLAIISTMIGMGVALFNASLSKTQLDITKQRMAVIQQALLDHRRAFHAIPCPADASLEITDTDFGRGTITDVSGDPCNGGSYTPNYAMAPLWGGGVPVRTLKIPDEYAFDGWGRKMMYFVHDDVTGGYGFKDSSISQPVGTLNIVDRSGTALASALYVLISYGENGHGAYTRKGDDLVNGWSTNTNEHENCGCDESLNLTGHDDTFVQSEYYIDPVDNTDVFDDIVVYGTRASVRLVTE